MRMLVVPLLGALALSAAACSSSHGASALPAMMQTRGASTALHKRTASTQLKHIVVVMQENRTVDDLFNGFCVNASICANTVTVDPVSGTPLVSTSLANKASPNHSHNDFVREYDGGKMDGFAKEKISSCKQPPCTAFAYVPASETAIYRQLATVDGLLSDATFQTMQGPSLPAHLYAIAGQSGGYDADHWAIEGGSGSCGTTKVDAEQILMTTSYPGQQGNTILPCKEFQTIFDLLANAGHTWRFYAHATAGFMEPTQNVQHLYGSPNFITPETKFLTDVKAGTLADVTFVTPTGANSDHPTWVKNATAGPTWIASVMNAVGESAFWNNTAVVVWWDDWGGYFDHVKPPAPSGMPSWMGNPDPFEYGFRVPLIVASPYAKVGTIDHTQRTFVSALRLIEETFGLGSLGTTDQYEPDGLDSMFNWNQTPISYTPLGGAPARPLTRVRPAARMP